MNQKIIDQINNDFDENQRALVLKELSTLELKHVMAESEINLENTRLAILKLSKGDFNEVSYLTKRAKIDFRDVIMWAIKEK